MSSAKRNYKVITPCRQEQKATLKMHNIKFELISPINEMSRVRKCNGKIDFSLFLFSRAEIYYLFFEGWVSIKKWTESRRVNNNDKLVTYGYVQTQL